MKVLGFAGSNSAKSINNALVKYTLTKFEGAETELLDLNNYEVAIYSPEREAESGIPDLTTKLAEKISSADLIVVSLAEHNGSYSAAFKNVYDWMSRIPNRKTWDGKSLLLMATSPGARGGQGVLESASVRFPRDGATVIGEFSLPSFYDNFSDNEGLTNNELEEKLTQIIKSV